VDLGVCYYNLSQAADAERLFQLAIARDPHQPVALFNLGIVHERRREYELALQYFHRALESTPPADMQQPLVESIRRIQEQTGRKVELSSNVDPDVLGGLIVRVGNMVLDATVRNRLERLRKQVTKAA